ncbi:hypothetical protein FB446DRAFT_713751 [Lentinula raphanica]|nr:hypothetical protein FB446DRAFT_713751 [Lentinula raphanica]
MSTTLFIAGLSSFTRARDLGEVFERFGPISRCDVLPPKKRIGTDRNPYAFVVFIESRHAAEALQSLNHTHFEGRLLKISWAEHPPSHDDQNPSPPQPSQRRATRSRSRSPLTVQRDVVRTSRIDPSSRHDRPSTQRRRPRTPDDFRGDRHYESPDNHRRDGGKRSPRHDWNSRHYEPSPDRYTKNSYPERRTDTISRSTSSSAYDYRSSHRDKEDRRPRSRSRHSLRTVRTSHYASAHASPTSSQGRHMVVEPVYERCSWDRSSTVTGDSSRLRRSEADERREFAPNRFNERSSKSSGARSLAMRSEKTAVEGYDVVRTFKMPSRDSIDRAQTPPGLPLPEVDVSENVDGEDYARTPPGEPDEVVDFEM